MDSFIYLLPECSLNALTLRCPNKSHTRINAHASKMHVLPVQLYLVSDVISVELPLLIPWTRVWCIITLSACICYSASRSSLPTSILCGRLSPSVCKSGFFSTISEKSWVKFEFVLKKKKSPPLRFLWMRAAASLSHWRTLRCVPPQEDRDLNRLLIRADIVWSTSEANIY